MYFLSRRLKPIGYGKVDFPMVNITCQVRKRRCFDIRTASYINVINVVWTLKRRRVLTGRSWFLLGFELRPQKIRFLHQIPLELTSCFFRYKKNKFCLWKKKPRKLKNIEFHENLKGVFFGYKKCSFIPKKKIQNTKISF